MIDLKGSWSLKDLTDGREYSAVVPSCNYLDLLRSGAIEDPFYGTNESKSLWVAEHDWRWTRYFDVDEDTLAADRAVLVCKQLDTLATVLVNGETVATANNCHIAHETDVKEFLHAGRNVVEVVIASPVRYIAAMKKSRGTPANLNGLDGIDNIRKPQCHFGWDWGPVLPPSGISGDIYIETRDKAHISGMKTAQKHGEGRVSLTVSVNAELLSAAAEDVKVRVRVVCPNGEELSDETAFAEKTEFCFDIEKPQLWWTRELSDRDEQPLYRVIAEAVAGGEVVSEKVRNTGLRTIALSRGKDAFGEDFCFVLNGVRVFAKGANMIPTDSFVTRTDEAKLTRLIEACADANFNMIRVWGGGYYASDALADLCDRKGILIWQDFGFACLIYPFYDEDFLSNVREEVVYNIERLREHPSLALWCGNNEMEAMSVNWIARKSDMKWNEQFFYHILPRWVDELDGVTPYIPSSPCGNGFLRNVQSDNIGDTHLWAVWHGLQPLTYYRRRNTRFCSEFGFESIPAPKTVTTFAGPQDMSLSSEVFKAHQKCASGNKKMIYYIASRFRLPDKFADYIYLSQVCQSECVSDAVEHWRRHRGRCNGALYWQLNDCWPVCSWAGIDYEGRLKCLHYRAKHFFAPLSASLYYDKKGIRVWALNDTRNPRALTAELQVVTMDGARRLFCREKSFVVAPLSGAEVAFVSFAQIVKRRRKIKDCVARVIFRDGDGTEISRRTLIFGNENKLRLPLADIKVSATAKDGKVSLTLTADKFARFVGLFSPLAETPFSDNFFDLMPGESRTVTVGVPADVGADNFVASLDIKQAAAITPAMPRIVEQLKRVAIFLEPVNFFSYLYYRFQI